MFYSGNNNSPIIKQALIEPHMHCSFQIIRPTDTDWKRIESSDDSTIFHSYEWDCYLKRIGFNSIIIRVSHGGGKMGEPIGYFIGQKIWRGVKIVSSPFEGIGTYTQGLVTLCKLSSTERISIYKHLAIWLFCNNIARFFQVDDWQLRVDSPEWDEELATFNTTLKQMQIMYEIRPTLHLDLHQTIEDLWSGLHYKSCKYSINKARKAGLIIQTVESFSDIKDFVAVHYSQLCEVCKGHGARPKASQSPKRMLALCESLFPDRILMLKVIGNDEQGQPQIMSSAIFAIDRGECSYWTGASYKQYQKYCPNELMVWEAIRILHERGAGDLNFCGMANYKLKFGTKYAYVPRLIFTRYNWILRAKKIAKNLYYSTRKRFL